MVGVGPKFPFGPKWPFGLPFLMASTRVRNKHDATTPSGGGIEMLHPPAIKVGPNIVGNFVSPTCWGILQPRDTPAPATS